VPFISSKKAVIPDDYNVRSQSHSEKEGWLAKTVRGVSIQLAFLL